MPGNQPCRQCEPSPKAHVPTMVPALCPLVVSPLPQHGACQGQPVSDCTWLHLRGPWEGFWTWSGWAERGWGRGREGEPIGAVWWDLLHGRRVQLTAGASAGLATLQWWGHLSQASTICLSPNLCSSDQWSHAPQTQEQCLKQSCWIYRPQMLPMPKFKQRHKVFL